MATPNPTNQPLGMPPLAPAHAMSGEPPLGEGLTRGISASQDHLLGVQSPDGYWWGELEANSAIHAEYLLLTHFLGKADPERWRKIVNYLREMQLTEGGWPVWHGGPSDLNCTVESYFAMKLAGVDPADPAMRKAREVALALGGVPSTRVFTKMWLALFGQWDWRGAPALPPEIMLIPSWAPGNIYDFGAWARATVVACTILLSLKPTCPVPSYANIDELYPLGRHRTSYTFGKDGPLLSWTGFFRGVDKGLRFIEMPPVKPLRGTALRKAERWLVERQEEDGSWGGIQPPWVYSLMALKTLGYSMDHPVMVKGFAGFERFGRETADTFHTEPCVSPVWDTCLAMLALQDSGLPSTHPALAKSADWLLKNQILDHGGDWQVKRPDLQPGGWAFEFDNQTYPDVDDTAMVLIALRKMGWDDNPRMVQAQKRGAAWMEGMQSSNGGWGSFDVDNNRKIMTAIPFCDFGEVIDPPTEDVTAHALEYFGRAGYDRRGDMTQRALRFLYDTQQPDGSWWGRWGVNYIYGLGSVLPALKWAGEDMGQPAVRKAIAWLESHQNADGGFGETCESYHNPALAGRGPSTASQTSWALLALISAGEVPSRTARRAVEYLLHTQKPHGSWDEPEFTGTGFPKVFMINYHMYRDYWPLMALGQYREALRQSPSPEAAHNEQTK